MTGGESAATNSDPGEPITDAGLNDDRRVDRSGSVNPSISDPVVAELSAAKRARKTYPAGHTFSMTNPVINGVPVSLGTCTCGSNFSYPYGGHHDQMDAAIEAHWQKFDHLPEKTDGRGQPIGEAAPAVEAKKPKRKAKSKPGATGQPAPSTPAPSRVSPRDGAGNSSDEYLAGIMAKTNEPAPIGAASSKVSEPPGRQALTSIDRPSVDSCSEADPVREAGFHGGSLATDDDEFEDSPLLRAALDLAWREEPVAPPQPGPVDIEQLHKNISLYSGSCLDALPCMAENSLDSCVTDPPYHLTTGKKSSGGFMGKAWDGGDVAFQVETWKQVFRVLKPGAHLIAFSGTRTYHRMVCAIEDAGFEIRDQIGWLYGSGFPKSRDISKAIDKEAGIRGHDGKNFNAAGLGESNGGSVFRSDHPDYVKPTGITDEAKQWDGWGTAVKPAQEPIVMARKPLSEKTVAANVLRWGTGAINIDGCRVDAPYGLSSGGVNQHDGTGWGFGDVRSKPHAGGRWPANIIHDASDEVLAAFPDRDAGGDVPQRSGKAEAIYGEFSGGGSYESRNDSGSAARFFYTAKADADDRIASKHPTIKPVDLMQYLCRMVTPKGGTVLDLFAGTGTTGEGAFREGFSAVLIEREEEYQNDIRRRVKLMLAGPEERAREIVKEKLKDALPDAGPLFGGSDVPPLDCDNMTEGAET